MVTASFFSTIGMDEQPINYFFGGYHLLYLMLNLLMFVVLFWVIHQKPRAKQDKFINISLVVIIFLKYAGEALFIYEYYNVSPAYSNYPHPFLDINTFFSFQLCGIMNILLPITIWFNIKKLKPFIYATSILGGLAVIFYPVTVLFGDPYQITFPIVRSSVVHFFLVLIPMILIARGDARLRRQDWYQIAIGLLLTGVWAMFGNLVIDKNANNMYLMVNPFLNGPIPIINQLPNGWHIIFLVVAVTFGYMVTFNFARLFTPKETGELL